MTHGLTNSAPSQKTRSARFSGPGVVTIGLVAICLWSQMSTADSAEPSWVTTVSPGAAQVAAAAEPQERSPAEPTKTAAPPAAAPPALPTVPAEKPAPANATASPPSAKSPAPPAAKVPAVAARQPSPPANPSPADPDGPDGETARQYCRVVLDRATRERIASESEASDALKKDIDARLAKLNAAIVEHEMWLKRRQDFQKKANDSLVKVYASMAAEAAAARLGAADEMVAAAILSMLAPKAASAVLSEMPPEKAARLTAYLAGAAAIRPEDAGPEKGSRP